MVKKWRLIVDGKNDGYYNMAADEAILENYSSQKIPTLRIYGWRVPFISLGYNQETEKVLTFKESVPFVRRITGGASIFHDREITYSITCSLSSLDLPAKVKESYEVLCGFIIRFYSMLGLEAKFAKDIFSSNLGRYDNFCFSSYEYFDLVVKGKKIGGNAQRRKKNVIFQQGSIPQLIDADKVKNLIKRADGFDSKITFLNELMKADTDFYYLQSLLAEAFKKTFDVEFIKEDINIQERKSVEYLLKTKYEQDSWNRYR